jgi:hypothetical protein
MDHWKCNFACFTVSKQQREKVGAIWIIDYIFAGGKKNFEFRGELCVIRQVLNSSYRISLSSPLKNEPLAQKIHLEVRRLGCC